MMDVAIAGSGIGGLSAALCLHSRGSRARIFEAAPEVRELGVGINIQPQAMGVLTELGLGDKLAEAGTPIEHWTLFNRFGQQIWTEKRGLGAGEPWPQIAINRGRLQSILLSAVRERMGADIVATDHRLTGFEERNGTMLSRYTTARGETRVESDILIAADGIHSAARRILFPGEGPPRFGGTILWRGVTRAAPFLGGATMALAGYAGRKVIAYPITRIGDDGRQTINWIADVHADAMRNREDWDRRGNVEDFLPLFEDWRFDWLDPVALIRATAQVFEYPMVDRDPLPRWSHGRMTLLGDAAHPMYPIGSNGASQAIRDAANLADVLGPDSDPVKALERYEAERREATSRIVLSNRGLGPEAVMNIAEARAPEGFRHINDVIPQEELEEAARKYRTITRPTGAA